MKNKQNGYTLIEIVSTIVIIGILAAVGISKYQSLVNERNSSHSPC